MIDRRSYAHNLIWPGRNSDLNGIGTHVLCDTGTVLYQLSYQANWESRFASL